MVFCTKYRDRVLRGKVQEHCRDLIRQVCDALDVRIIKGVVSSDHVHLHLSYPPKRSVSEVVRRIKARSARKLLAEYPSLKKRYWGGSFWGIGYGAWSTGEIVQEYLEHHRHRERLNDPGNFILE